MVLTFAAQLIIAFIALLRALGFSIRKDIS